MLESRVLLTALNPYTTDPLHLSLGFAVYRPSTAMFYADTNRDGTADQTLSIGQAGDKVIHGDMNGDGLTDVGVFRNGQWLLDLNHDGGFDVQYNFGQAGDIALIGDVDSDGYGDLILYRAGRWLVSTNRDGVANQAYDYGLATDLPVIGDFNADGRLDRAVYRPSTGTWYADSAFTGVLTSVFSFGGQAGDIPFAMDFNNDQFTDFGIARNGNILINVSRTGSTDYSFPFGGAGDVPVMGNYSTAAVAHTRRTGLALYDPTTGVLSLDPSQTGAVTSVRTVGLPGDQIVAADFDGNTVTDTAVLRNGVWYIDTTHDGVSDSTVLFGLAGDIAVAGDVNHDGFADLMIYRGGVWLIDLDRNGTADMTSSYGTVGDVPIAADFNGDDILDRAVYRNGLWHVDFDFNNTVDTYYSFGGASGDKPFAFDFNYDGKDDMGIFRNGAWIIDLTHTAFPSLIYHFGSAGLIPMAGHFETANSKFVRAGAVNGDGTEAKPYGSIYTAVLNAANGAFIRVAPGTYNESVVITARSNLTLVSANRYGTTVRATAGSGIYVEASANIFLENFTTLSVDTNPLFGGGLVVYGSTVFGRGILAVGSYRDNVVTAAPTGGFGLLYLRDSQLNASQTSAGMMSQGRTILRMANVRVANNGTSTTHQQQWGRGIVLIGMNNVCNFRGLMVTDNLEHGFVADGGGDMLLLDNTFQNHPNANGAIIAQLFSFVIESCKFINNGVKGNLSKAFNGLEVDLTGTHLRGTISNSLFQDNAEFGIFLGGGPLFVVQFNTFINNDHAQLIVHGVDLRPSGSEYVTGSTLAYVLGNSFFVTAGSLIPGLAGAGSGAVAYIGGAESWMKNTFTNFPIYSSIFVDRDPDDHASIANFYCLPESSNIFINSSAFPIGGYGAKALP